MTSAASASGTPASASASSLATTANSTSTSTSASTLASPLPLASPSTLPDDALARALRLLASAGTQRRLIGLVGPPGAGKSTVAEVLLAA
ncbi:MAG: hypothetical protein RL375_4560, partial [Pseudomonadota bacterium]